MIDQRIQLTTTEDLNAFLATGVRENFILDFKRDFPSNLEKTLSAFANTYGGTVLIGVEETSTGAAVLPVTGVELRPGLRERILQIALDNIHPPVVPGIHVLAFKSAEAIAEPDRAVVVVRVHESHEAPHAIERGTAVYLRVDNISDRFERKATIGEIEWLVNKRAKSLAERERLLEHVRHHADVYTDRRTQRNYVAGTRLRHEGEIEFYTVPRFPRSPLTEARCLVEIAREATVHVSVAPTTLPAGTPHPIAEGVVFENSYGSSEFQQQGMVYHRFDFWWDHAPTSNDTRHSRVVLPTVSASLIWGMLELGGRFYNMVGFGGLVDIAFRFKGIYNALFTNQEHDWSYDASPIVDNSVTVRRTCSVSEITQDTASIAKECQKELYWACGINASDVLVERDFTRCGLK